MMAAALAVVVNAAADMKAVPFGGKRPLAVANGCLDLLNR